MHETFRAALPAESLAKDSIAGVILNGWQIVLSRGEHGVSAVSDRCPHAEASLSAGRARRGIISCPLHGARFDLHSGKCIGGLYPPLRVFETRINDGVIEVAVPDEPQSF